MENSRLLKVIHNNETSDRRQVCSRLMKQFEGVKEKDSTVQKKERVKPSNNFTAAQQTEDSRHVGESLNISNIKSISTLKGTSSNEPKTKVIDDTRPVSMEIENAQENAPMREFNENQRDCDMFDDEVDQEAIRKVCDAFPMSFESDQIITASSSGSKAKKKKCLEKEIRPPDANINSSRKDSLSTASNRSSLDPINEENSYDDLLLPEKSDDSIEIEEIEAQPRSSRERTSSILSNRSSLEPIQEDLETNAMDINENAESSSLESCEDAAKEVKTKPARSSKISLETITEEAGISQSDAEHDLIVRKHPLPFPSKPQDFSWFDLQSPMIKPSRKRRYEETEDNSFLMCSFEEENVSCEELTLPYNVLDYRQSVNALEQKDELKDKSFSSPSFQNSASIVTSGHELKQILSDLRSKVQRHEDSIRKISEALHASLGVNANLNEHLIHCHRNLLTERQSRQLLLEEMDRLERDKQAPRSLLNVSCGKLVISNISLPLKPSDAQMSTEEPCDEEFYFICLLKCPSGRLVPSDMICVPRQSRRGSVDFRARFSLSQVPSDFIIHLEIYTMTLIRRSISGSTQTDASEADDSISDSSSISNLAVTSHQGSTGGSAKKRFRFIKNLLTPSKSGKRQPTEGSDVNVNDEDDEGWRTTGFSILSSVKITKETVSQSEFSLGRIPHLYPLAGNLKMNISLNYGQENIEERGFMSIFSHVGGFGAWERLWCALKPNRILMWRYPDEEVKGVKPVRTIELDQCLSERASLASKDICFRPQTLVIRMAPSLKTESKPVQLLLSADTKSERVVWCNKINRCLNSLRSWNPSHFEEIQKRFCDN